MMYPSDCDTAQLDDGFLSLLQDSEGPYGMAIKPLRERKNDAIYVFSLRPDKVQCKMAGNAHGMLLQRIPRVYSNSRKIFDFAEGCFARVWAENSIERNGHELITMKDRRKWLQVYHGNRAIGLKTVNWALNQIYPSADPDALRCARKFPPNYRWNIYRFTVGRPWRQQLALSFPCLAVGTFRGPTEGAHEERRLKAIEMIDAGARLKEIADLAGLPMCLRKILPGATTPMVAGFRNVVSPLVDSYLPAKVIEQKKWFSVIDAAIHKDGPYAAPCMTEPDPYVIWAAKNWRDVETNEIKDIGDFVKASFAAETERSFPFPEILDLPEHLRELITINIRGSDNSALVPRLFNQYQTIRTVRSLSDKWHDSVALADYGGEDHAISVWRDTEVLDGYSFEPLRSITEVVREGGKMHNCAQTYIKSILSNSCRLYMIKKGDERVAMIEVDISTGGVTLGQARGPCNSCVDEKIRKKISQWMAAGGWVPTVADVPEFADDIPF